MKRRTRIPRLSKKKLAASDGRPIYSTIASPRKAVRKSNPIAKAKREARYRKVISSPRWKALRRKVWERMNYYDAEWTGSKECERCASEIPSIREMQLAHLTYARFGKELDTDVQGQCKQCNQTEAALRGKRIRRTA